MRSRISVRAVGAHAEGEEGEIIVGGIPFVTGDTMLERVRKLQDEHDWLRQLVLNEPRGKVNKNSNILLPPISPGADFGLAILESCEYVPMSGSNTICAVTVALETGIVKMQEPKTQLLIDTVAGPVSAEAVCSDGRCQSVKFTNVPAFVLMMDKEIHVPGIGSILIDVVWGGMIYAMVRIEDINTPFTPQSARDLAHLGERIKQCAREQVQVAHPLIPSIEGISNVEFIGPVTEDPRGGKTAANTVIVSPGRHDRSPCGTGTCARLAVLHARGQLAEHETFYHKSLIGTEFVARVEGVTKVGDYQAVIPSIQGRAWISSFHDYVLDPSDPFPRGFRVGDNWGTEAADFLRRI
ncbi:unnamed protein product [Sympodiomycopsis kandeliae]